MNFTDFFQQNITLFLALFGVSITLIIITMREQRTKGTTLNSQQLSIATNRGAQLIDLREADDFKLGHIPGAKNIPFDSLESKINAIGKKKDQQLIIYCYSGKKGAVAINTLKEQGFTDIGQLEGGFESWKKENMPITKN